MVFWTSLCYISFITHYPHAFILLSSSQMQSLFYLSHFFALLFLSLELPTLHHGLFPFSFFSGCYYWLHTSTQRFRAKTHKKREHVTFVFWAWVTAINIIWFSFIYFPEKILISYFPQLNRIPLYILVAYFYCPLIC